MYPAPLEEAGIHSGSCRGRVEQAIAKEESERYNNVLENIMSMVEEDLQTQGKTGELKG